MHPCRLAAYALAACAILTIGGCSGDNALLREMGVVAGPGWTERKAPDFVAGSRKEGGDFMPVGVSAPARPIRARSADSQKALEAELDSARSRNLSRGKAAEGAARMIGNQPPAQPPAVIEVE